MIELHEIKQWVFIAPFNGKQYFLNVTHFQRNFAHMYPIKLMMSWLLEEEKEIQPTLKIMIMEITRNLSVKIDEIVDAPNNYKLI